MKTIYQRTAKGNEEIKKRLHKLDHEHRFVLIMIDGKATVNEIISRSSEQWKPVQCLYELETKGFIKNIDSNAAQASNLSELKQNLILTIQKFIPEKNKKIIHKIINAKETKRKLSDAIDSSCIYIKLTISEDIAKQLKTELHRILNKAIEV
jgi:hypothetical protein